jgi:hypothetical protein
MRRVPASAWAGAPASTSGLVSGWAWASASAASGWRGVEGVGVGFVIVTVPPPTPSVNLRVSTASIRRVRPAGSLLDQRTMTPCPRS